MAQVTITINSREYAVACDDGEEAHIIRLSRILDEKARLLNAGGAHINENMLLAMVGLLVADELSEARKNQTAAIPAVQPQAAAPVSAQAVQQAVEQAVKADLEKLDQELAQSICDVSETIKTLANAIESL